MALNGAYSSQVVETAANWNRFEIVYFDENE